VNAKQAAPRNKRCPLPLATLAPVEHCPVPWRSLEGADVRTRADDLMRRSNWASPGT